MTTQMMVGIALRPDRVELLDTPIDRIEYETIQAWLYSFIVSGAPHQIVTANLDFIAIARKRPQFAKVIRAADLVVCDGKPLQWAASIQGIPIPARVTGMDLTLHAAVLSARYGFRIFLLGALPGVAEKAAARILEFIPGTVIVGCYSPPKWPFTAQEDAEIVAAIKAANPDALFVALGAPRQDEWIHQHLEDLDVQVCVGVGGVFNFLAGKMRRAPTWMQQAGLEWAFRLMQEPSRLWKRYLVNDLPVFVGLLISQLRHPNRRSRIKAAKAARKSGAPLAAPASRSQPLHSADTGKRGSAWPLTDGLD